MTWGIRINILDEAVEKCSAFAGKDIVVKSCSTNFGKGVDILKGTMPRDDCRWAIEQAFEYDGTVLVETFIPGDEYRFLIIDDDVAQGSSENHGSKELRSGYDRP